MPANNGGQAQGDDSPTPPRYDRESLGPRPSTPPAIRPFNPVLRAVEGAESIYEYYVPWTEHRYTIGRHVVLPIWDGLRKMEFFERDGYYLPRSVVEQLVADSETSRTPITPAEWDRIFRTRGSRDPNVFVPQQPPQQRILPPANTLPGTHVPNGASSASPTSQPGANLAYVEKELQPSFTGRFFGEIPARIRVYYDASGLNAAENREIAYAELERLVAKQTVDEVRRDVDVVVNTTDMVAREVFSPADIAITIIEGVAYAWEKKNLKFAVQTAAVVATVLIIGRHGDELVPNGGFTLGKHGDFPLPRPANTQSHHGAMSAWLKAHFDRYDPELAPAILMPKVNHERTFGVFNTWRAEMKRRMGGTFDWKKISEEDMRELSEKMFDAANVPAQMRKDYWEWFERMKNALLQNPK